MSVGITAGLKVDPLLGKGTFQHLPDAVPLVQRQPADVWQLCRPRPVLDFQGKVWQEQRKK